MQLQNNTGGNKAGKGQELPGAESLSYGRLQLSQNVLARIYKTPARLAGAEDGEGPSGESEVAHTAFYYKLLELNEKIKNFK